MRKRPLDDLLQRMAPAARPLIRSECVPNCCIATCAILTKVFAAYHYSAEAIPVTVVAANARMARAFLNGERIPPSDNPERDNWFRFTGAYALAILPESAAVSAANGTPGFGGHTILRVKERLVDASIAQISRPAFNLRAPDFLNVPVVPDFLRGMALEITLPDGATLSYQRLNDYSFRTAPDWRWKQERVDLYQGLVAEIINAIERGEHEPQNTYSLTLGDADELPPAKQTHRALQRRIAGQLACSAQRRRTGSAWG